MIHFYEEPNCTEICEVSVEIVTVNIGFDCWERDGPIFKNQRSANYTSYKLPLKL